MRRPHWLRPNMLTRTPTVLGAFDTETDEIEIGATTTEQRLRFGWVLLSRWTGNRWTEPARHRFETPEACWRQITAAIRPKARLVLGAHNAGFDLRVTDAFAVLPALGWTLTRATIDDPPTICRWTGPGGRGLLVIDTMNWWPVPLRVLGETVGLSKLVHDFRWGERERDDAYCVRDAEIVLRALQLLVDRTREWDLGDWAPTAAGLAWHAWRHRHMATPLFIDDNERGLALARAGYFGGRVEPWRIGPVPGPVREVDMTGMYPAMMRTLAVPRRHIATVRTLSVADLAGELTTRVAVARVDIETPEPLYPRREGRYVTYPVGRFTTVLAKPELYAALRRGHILRVRETALYDAVRPFTGYVDEWWGRRLDARRAGDAGSEAFAKLMLNSLAGKFGQRGRRWEAVREIDPAIVGQWTEVDAETGEVTEVRAFGGLLSRLVVEGESRDSHPAVAAHITSAARVRLWEIASWVGADNVYYLDTDSLHLSPAGWERIEPLLEDDTLGGLRLRRTADRVAYWAPRWYVWGDRVVEAGRSRRSWPIDRSQWLVEHWESLADAVQVGDLSAVRITRRPWRRRTSWEGRYVRGDGLTVPWRIDALDP